MEPFNLDEDKEEGHFDENGNFVWAKNEEKPDEWLASMGNEAEMEEAIGKAAAAQAKQRQESAAAEAAHVETDVKSTLTELIRILEHDDEMPVQALKRLAAPKISAAQRAAMRRDKSGKKKEVEDVRTDEQKAQFIAITECADRLVSANITDVYQMTRDQLEEKLEQQIQLDAVTSAFTTQGAAAADAANDDDAGPIGAQWASQNGLGSTGSSTGAGADAGPADGGQWEYRGQDGAVHGPFSTAQIVSWRSQGFFTGDSAVEMRKIGGSTGAAGAAEKEKSLEDDLMADFDSDDEGDADKPKADGGAEKEKEAGGGGWASSDAIDFTK